MSDSADMTYEELNSTIASLRADIGILQSKLNAANDEQVNLRNQILREKDAYIELLRESYKLLGTSNRTISNLAEEISNKRYNYE